MPRRFKKKTFRKKPRRGYRKRNRLSLTQAPIGKRHFCKLRYFWQGTVNPGIGTAAAQVFRSNDLYDPDATGSGAQPRGFDEFMLMYNHFTVLGAKITANFTNEDTSIPVGIYVYVDGTSSSASSIANVMEKPNVASRTITGTTGGQCKGTIVKKCSTKRELGMSRILDEHSLRGTSTSSPTETLFFHVGAFPQDGASNPGTCVISCVIDYLVCFTEPKAMAQS